MTTFILFFMEPHPLSASISFIKTFFSMGFEELPKKQRSLSKTQEKIGFYFKRISASIGGSTAVVRVNLEF
jgi:hypothetical protein